MFLFGIYRGAGKSLSQPGMKQARKHVGDAHDFNNIETRAVNKFLFLQGKAPKEIHAILTNTLACFLPGRAKDLSAPLYRCPPATRSSHAILTDTLACFLTGRAKDLSAPLYRSPPATRSSHAILTDTLACFLPGRAKDLSAPL